MTVLLLYTIINIEKKVVSLFNYAHYSQVALGYKYFSKM